MCPIQHNVLKILARAQCAAFGSDFAEYGYVALDTADVFAHEDDHDNLVS